MGNYSELGWMGLAELVVGIGETQSGKGRRRGCCCWWRAGGERQAGQVRRRMSRRRQARTGPDKNYRLSNCEVS